jgi:hypothetical protein
MKTNSPVKLDSKTNYAAQSAREGLIDVFDLSLLTGVDMARLNRFSKLGLVNHYGEYHGKRFFNFEEIANWVCEPGDENEAKILIRSTMEALLKGKNCPYALEKVSNAPSDGKRIRVIWKEFVEA